MIKAKQMPAAAVNWLMAELPDLTVFAQILNRKFKGKVVAGIDVTLTKKLNVPAAELIAAVAGKSLTEVKRAGKTLQLHFSKDVVLGLHLMLRGELVELNDEAPRFQIAAFILTMERASL
ncbi:DNA-formamidopyrimidine glycosylase family protein [Mucilaginibacter calamicampi]|uniref:DNA-formamidopyrimidine glycosylase family protein n=1 Tax=Mucilaginibacter calamicampi TaxID=1302352 RepID=A0ABW2YUZ2_9SPHI